MYAGTVLGVLILLCIFLASEAKAFRKRNKHHAYSGFRNYHPIEFEHHWATPNYHDEAMESSDWYKNEKPSYSRQVPHNHKPARYGTISHLKHSHGKYHDFQNDKRWGNFPSSELNSDRSNFHQSPPTLYYPRETHKVKLSNEETNTLKYDQMSLFNEKQKETDTNSKVEKLALSENQDESCNNTNDQINGNVFTGSEHQGLSKINLQPDVPMSITQPELPNLSDNTDIKTFSDDETELRNLGNLEVSENVSFEDDLNSSGFEDLKIEVGETTSNNGKESIKEESTQHFEKKVLETVIKSEEDKHLFNTEINQLFDNNFKSFVFNPNAQPQERFQECSTPNNETGFCRYVQHCMLPSILNSVQHFMDNVCVIEERFIGVCCPEFPVWTQLIDWGEASANSSFLNDETVETPEDCGVAADTRIIGGVNAKRMTWPWMVALINNKNKFFCGGALINNRFVLTAAHCTFGAAKSQIVARLGEYDFNDPRGPHDDYKVVEIKRHGQYNSFTLRNDIALLKLEKPVVFNEHAKTICLPETEKDYIGETATLVGWGYQDGSVSKTSDILQEASFPIISNVQCSRVHGVSIPSTIICAAAPSQDKGACNGDSGGPLMLLDEKKRWKVIGLVSWGRRGCSPTFPTAYTRVTHFMDWIRTHSNRKS